MTDFMSEDVGVPGSQGAGMDIEIRLMAKVLAGLFAAGATLALLTVVLPHSARASTLGLLLIVANAYLVSGLLLWRARVVSPVVLPFALGWGSTLVTGVAYFSGESPSPLIFFYLWVFLYSSYFFSRRQAVLQILYVGVAYASLLLANPPRGSISAWWIVAMGTLLVAAVLIRVMRERVELLIARLYDAARTDPLTMLPNRRGFRELLDLELERARRSGGQMSLLFGDLDHFKEVNDRSGHHVGDATLQRVANVLNAGRRQIDAGARIGGEQFALILPDTEENGAFVIAERLRCALCEEFVRETVPITISFGIATYPNTGETAASLLRAAEQALLAAKENGRNRTVLHSPALLAEGPDKRDIEGERFVAVVLDLAETVDLRFSGSARHAETVGRYAEMMARELGLSEQRVSRVRLAGMLHDIGKVGIPEAILGKPGKLTEQEFAAIKKHSELGEQILQHSCLTDVSGWVGAHHERPDGSGYPLGLSGDAIALEARILAVADAYEAMTSDRAYRSSIGHARARAELQRCAGSQFDRKVIDAFLTVLKRESQRAEAILSSS